MTRHFYAGGERHTLEPAADWVAIDTRAAAAAGLSGAVAGLPVVSRLPGGILLVSRSACADELYSRIDAASALRQAYRTGRAIVVPMPEVRVEFESGQQADALRALGESKVPADITDSASDRLTLRPRSGKGEDALDLANYIYEHARPSASSVRMLQIVPKPGRPT